MRTINALALIAEQVPENVRDQFDVQILSDPMFLATVVRFRHHTGVIIEEKIAEHLSPGMTLALTVSQDTIAKLCLIAR